MRTSQKPLTGKAEGSPKGLAGASGQEAEGGNPRKIRPETNHRKAYSLFC